MTRRILLYILLVLPLLMIGCEKDNEPDVPTLPDILEGAIPIVFHVMYDTNPEDPKQNPSNDVFLERIGQLNKFYSASLFPDAKSTVVDVTFTLATHDPDGVPMKDLGVNRVHYSGSSDMSADDFITAGTPAGPNTPAGRPLTTNDRKILWDPDKYVNIWLFSFTEENVTGVAYLPYGTSTNPLQMLHNGDYWIANSPNYMHGIALNNKYFSPVKDKPLSEDEGMFTLCHEMGHYLGLLHAYIEPNKDGTSPDCGGNPADNASDDGCSDTPKYDRAKYTVWLNETILQLTPEETIPEEVFSRNPCDDEMSPFISTNVMDYFYGTRQEITPQQRDRIEHVIAYSPWIPRSTKDTKALLDNFTGEITDERPIPILMY